MDGQADGRINAQSGDYILSPLGEHNKALIDDRFVKAHLSMIL